MLLKELQEICEAAPLAAEQLQDLNTEIQRLKESDALGLLDRILERAITLIDSLAALRKQG